MEGEEKLWMWPGFEQENNSSKKVLESGLELRWVNDEGKEAGRADLLPLLLPEWGTMTSLWKVQTCQVRNKKKGKNN